jgi:hypothetical protein
VVRHDLVPVFHDYDFLEVVEAKESAKKEAAVPEGIRNPGIKVIVIRRRCIISDYRRSILVVVSVDHGGDVILTQIGLGFVSLAWARCACHNRQP